VPILDYEVLLVYHFGRTFLNAVELLHSFLFGATVKRVSIRSLVSVRKKCFTVLEPSIVSLSFTV